MESSDEVKGMDTEPSSPTPTLAELLVFFSAKVDSTALTKAIDRVVPPWSGSQTRRKVISL